MVAGMGPVPKIGLGGISTYTAAESRRCTAEGNVPSPTHPEKTTNYPYTILLHHGGPLAGKINGAVSLLFFLCILCGDLMVAGLGPVPKIGLGGISTYPAAGARWCAAEGNGPSPTLCRQEAPVAQQNRI